MSDQKNNLENVSDAALMDMYQNLLDEKQKLEKDREVIDKKMLRSKQRTIELFGKMIDEKKAQRIISWQNEALEAKNLEINRQKKALEKTFKKFRERTIELFGKMIDLKKANRIIQNQNIEIEKQRKLLDEINSSKDRFFSILAHDLRNPIAGFLGLTELMVNKPELDNETQKVFIQNLYDNSKQLYSLLENLLDWARSQTGSIQLSKSNINLKGLFDLLIHQAAASLQLKKLKIINKGDFDFTVYADNDTLKTVVRNLISNAIKFSKPNNVITITASKDNNQARVAIHDSGVGMSDKTMKKLFKIDKSVSKLGTANEKGTGLGLILCKEFIELNHGTIDVKSKLHHGSTFTITIPLTAPH